VGDQPPLPPPRSAVGEVVDLIKFIGALALIAWIIYLVVVTPT
jgi:hypothetical protein